MTQLAGVVAVTSAFPGAANAAKYGPLGSSSPGVLDPKEAIIDDEVFNSTPVQQALKDVKGYAALVTDMKATLTANDQVNLGPVLRKEFDFSKLRGDLNTLIVNGKRTTHFGVCFGYNYLNPFIAFLTW